MHHVTQRALIELDPSVSALLQNTISVASWKLGDSMHAFRAPYGRDNYWLL